jgi:hypothetical protein
MPGLSQMVMRERRGSLIHSVEVAPVMRICACLWHRGLRLDARIDDLRVSTSTSVVLQRHPVQASAGFLLGSAADVGIDPKPATRTPNRDNAVGHHVRSD